jgi:uncharacterized protein GlcG (DUF336 family)
LTGCRDGLREGIGERHQPTPSGTPGRRISGQRGVPIVVDGKIIGAIGVSGGTSAQDGQCAKAGADAVR